MKVDIYKIKRHIIENRYILSDNNILFNSTHLKKTFFYKKRNILSQFIFLTGYFVKVSYRVFFRNSHLLWLKNTCDSRFIIYSLNNKYSQYFNSLKNINILKDSIEFNVGITKVTFKEVIIDKLVRFYHFILTYFIIGGALLKRRVYFKYCNFEEIIHIFQSIQCLLHFKWNLKCNQDYILLALNSDSFASALHNYSDVRVISLFFEYLNNNEVALLNDNNWCEKIGSINNLHISNKIKIGAIPPKLIKFKTSSLNNNLYVVDTCDVEDFEYNKFRINILSNLYNNKDLVNYNIHHIFHPGISNKEYFNTLSILPLNTKIKFGLNEIIDIPSNSLAIGFHSTALFSFAYIKCKVYVFPKFNGFIFDDFFKSTPNDLINFKFDTLFNDQNYDPEEISEKLMFNKFDQLISFLNS
jgi:hypothetical protein